MGLTLRVVALSGKVTVAKRVNAPPEVGALSRLRAMDWWGGLAMLGWVYGVGALYGYLIYLRLWPPDWMGDGWISAFAGGLGYPILCLGGFWMFRGKLLQCCDRPQETDCLSQKKTRNEGQRHVDSVWKLASGPKHKVRMGSS